ncbi:Protein of unknown function [Ekhidna lutea]|uniref:DUF2452 domain-containing protein n=1 Tax=Ekhidna lutea TaxID=447679 RepID=A0A239LKX3_EKHLU|nr:DUF2452 domain-containing protein [Ekhidna lutea]SNT30552.1 Protein of unknown function [Ekhidna lutea]
MSNKKIDIAKIDLEKEREKISDIPGLIEYAHHAGSAIIKPEDKGRIKGNAVAAMHDQTDRQFQQLYEQMQTLIEQAKYLQNRVEVSERIYQAHVPFQPVIGKVYYLYNKSDGSDLLSMVSPAEWGKNFPYEAFEAEVRLLSDHTWEIIKANSETYNY